MPRLWRILIYLSITLLPIAWIYSIAPLLPVIIYQGPSKKIAGEAGRPLLSRTALRCPAVGRFLSLAVDAGDDLGGRWLDVRCVAIQNLYGNLSYKGRRLTCGIPLASCC